ncbi:MAG: hypothetical protein K2X27_02110 [Candidatus Obscuribacterales bacterium]|nr:hypothetical protein [Candidatus Obscuribacterales bacterium]
MNLALKNRLRLLFSSAFCLLALTACDDAYLSWSPDGNSMAFIGNDGLHFADADGNLSGTIGEAEQVAWLPDSKRVVITDSFRRARWTDAKEYLTATQQKEAIELASYIERQIELRGLDALDKDEKFKQAPQYLTSAAMLYLLETDAPHLKVIIGKSYDDIVKFCALEIHRLKVREANVASESKELWHGLADIVGARISPDGRFALIVQKKQSESDLYDLMLMPLEPNANPIKIADIAAENPAWTPDSRNVIFMEALDKNNSRTNLASLSLLAVRGDDGALLKTFSSPSKLLYLVQSANSDIHCLKDGRILFSSASVELPATGRELSGKENVFSFKLGEHFARKLMSTNDAENEHGVSPMQVNSDETRLILGRDHYLHILNLQSGNVDTVEIKETFKPCWRNADELCFAQPVKEKSANRHDAEIVLHSMSTGKERIISNNWPATAVDGILIEKKK